MERVNHPPHYGGDTPYEVLKVLEAWLTAEEFRGFLLGSAIKYLARLDKKIESSTAVDLEKAIWCLEYLKAFDAKRDS